MSRFDRLTTLLSRFRLAVHHAPPATADFAVLSKQDGEVCSICFRPGGTGFADNREHIVFSAAVDWSGTANPLLAALPAEIMMDLANDDASRGLVEIMQSEQNAGRCGASSVISRLGEVLIVRMLRAQIEAGAAEPGLLAGLSDPRISRAIVAIHDHPGRNWSNQDLAEVAGLSLSRFADMFLALVGETPAAYLRRWRMTLARQDIERGDRVEAVSRRYGYGSPEGFTRAFKKQFGEKPVAVRANAA